MNRFFMALATAALLPLLAFAEEAPAPLDPSMHPDDDAYFSRQAEALLKEAGRALDSHPPQVPEPLERRLALLVMDGVLHEKYAPNRPGVQAFYHARIQRAVEEMEQAKVESGVRIWKLYNHGFVVKSPSVTLAFDINPGPEGFRVNNADKSKASVPSPGFPIEAALRERLVRQCDVLFISHRHGDHANESIAELFLEQGKPVVAPPEVFEGKPLAERLTRLERTADKKQKLELAEGKSIEVVVFPGQQYQGGGPPNNVSLVFTPEGISVAHNGDQINDPYPQYQEDFKWIDKVHEQYPVDVLITNCWTNDVLRMVRGFAPKLVLTGHECELSHPLWDRVPYWGDEAYLQLNFSEMKKEWPTVVMTWGESLNYPLAGN